MDEKEVAVSVENGVAVLTEEVGTARERRAAERQARRVITAFLDEVWPSQDVER